MGASPSRADSSWVPRGYGSPVERAIPALPLKENCTGMASTSAAALSIFWQGDRSTVSPERPQGNDSWYLLTFQRRTVKDMMDRTTRPITRMQQISQSLYAEGLFHLEEQKHGRIRSRKAPLRPWTSCIA